MTRTVIRGGTVVDGTGAPGRPADVAVDGDRIVEVGPDLAADGGRELDATGCVVAPGFIDIHTHYDAQVLWDPDLTPSSWHGVTTVVMGNCGFSIAPVRPDEGPDLIARTLEGVEDMHVDSLLTGVPWDTFESFGQYLQAVEDARPRLNVGAYVGHTALRLYVQGERAYEQPPSPDELERMQALVAEALEAGAIGFSTSSSPTHVGIGGRPVPSRHAGLDEVGALARPLRDLDRGILAMLPGEKIQHGEVYELQRELGRPATWTALLTFPNGWHEKLVALNDRERAAGADVWPQVSCRPLAQQLTMAAPFAFQMLEPFAELLGQPRDEVVRRYRDPAWRERAWEAATSHRMSPRWDAISVAETERHTELVGRPVADLAAERDRTPLDVVLDLALEEDLRTRFLVTLLNDDEDGVAWLLGRDGLVLGLSDAGAHISQICDAVFATDLLGRWVRERGALELEHAVHKLTGEVAGVFGLEDRGVLRPGAHADVTVFDPATVAPGPLRRVADLPAGGERLIADEPVGIAHVLVNGTPVTIDGDPVPDARPGRLVPGPAGR